MHQRQRELAKIHCLKRDLGLDDVTYRDMLETVAGVRSAAQLDAKGRHRVLDHLKQLGGGKKQYPGRPGNTGVKRELTKIEALLTEAGRPWSYAHGISKHMFQVDRVQWCNGAQLRAVIAALHRDKLRREARDES